MLETLGPRYRMAFIPFRVAGHLSATDLAGRAEEVRDTAELLHREALGERGAPVDRHRPPDWLGRFSECLRNLYYHTPAIGGMGDATGEAGRLARPGPAG
jgi:hypothetical protein